MARDLHRALIRTASAALAAALLALGVADRAPAAPAPLTIAGETIADGETYDAAKREGTVLLYSTYESTSLRLVLDRFTADTGIHADAIRLTSQAMFERVTAEFAAHKLAADWVDTSDLSLTQQLADKQILRAARVPDFAALEPSLRDGDGRWYAFVRGLGTLAANTGEVAAADLPHTWHDLLDPKWKGKLGLVDIEAGGTAYAQYYFLRQRFGLDFWRRLAAQQPRVQPAAAPVVTDLARGETSVAITGLDSTLAAILQGAPLKSIVPPEGVPSYALTGGVTSSAPHPHAALVWLAWVTSKRGSAAVGARSYGIARDGAPPALNVAGLPAERSLYNIRPADYLATHAAYVREWHAIFGAR